jgi:hypothetical protein
LLLFRGQIQKVINPDKVEKMLIDIGISVVLDDADDTMMNMKYLKKEFGKLPHLAGVGSLYAIQAADDNGQCSHEAVLAFHEMAMQKILYAKNVDFKAH